MVNVDEAQWRDDLSYVAFCALRELAHELDRSDQQFLHVNEVVEMVRQEAALYVVRPQKIDALIAALGGWDATRSLDPNPDTPDRGED